MKEKIKNITGQQRNLIFYGFLSLSLVLILVLGIIASEQNTIWAQEDAMHKKGIEYIQAGEFDKADPLYQQLLAQERNQKSPNLYWEYGVCLASQEEYEKALPYYEQAQEKDMFLVNNSSFMYQWSKLLFENGQIDKAQNYLTLARAEVSDEDEQVKAQMDKLLQELEERNE